MTPIWKRNLLGALVAFGAINAFAGGWYGLSGAPGVPLEFGPAARLQRRFPSGESRD